MTQPAGQCATTDCGRAAVTRGYCPHHYRRRLHTGRYGYKDAAPARAHVEELRQLGWTFEAIARTAGVSPYVPNRLALGRTRSLWPESAAALLSVPLVRAESHRGVPALGSRRRVQALAWMGWPNHEIARRIGCSPRSLPTLLARGRLSVRLAHRIADVYDELSGLHGPSKGAAGKARQLGFAPPAAWDDDRIDSRHTRPAGVRSEAA